MAQKLILDRYQPVEVAGIGGFGKVIVAWDTRIQRKVAIKCIELRDSQINSAGETISMSDPNVATKLFSENKTKKVTKAKVDKDGEHWQADIPGLNEARTAAMIQDSNIVTVYDFELVNNMAYIIMEYVEGITLTEFLSKYSQDITLDMVTCIISGISRALSVAHEQNVLHLDIKPDNVIIDTKGHVKVTDFGLATLADEFGYGKANAGTIGYMPPEQMRQQGLDIRSDLWALSSITYEMLTGNNPFIAKDINSALNIIYDTKIVAPSNCWEDLSLDVNEVIFKGLNPDPDKRYFSINDFSQDLMQHLGSSRSGQKQIAELLNSEQLLAYKPKNSIEKNADDFNNSIWMQVLGRGFSAICSAGLAFIAALNIPFFGGSEVMGFAPNVFCWLSIAAAFALACFLPWAGVSLGLILISVAMFCYSNIFLGVILIVLTLLWVVFSGFYKLSHTNCTCLFPALGAIGFSQMAPLLTGFYNKPKFAAINSTFGFVICLIFASMGSMTLLGWDPGQHAFWGSIRLMSGDLQNTCTQLITNPAVLVLGFSWVTSATIISVFFEFQQRGLRIFGACLASIVLLSGLLVHVFLNSDMTTFTPLWWQTLPTLIACIIAILISIFKPSRQVSNSTANE